MAADQGLVVGGHATGAGGHRIRVDLGRGGQSDWADQVAQVTTAAKRVLVRRGLLDITHGLRLPPLPGAWTAQRDGVPASRSPAAADGESGSRKGAMP